MSPRRAAGTKPISTVGQPGGKIGPPTWGTGGVPGVAMGQVCKSPTRAAGGMMFSFRQAQVEHGEILALAFFLFHQLELAHLDPAELVSLAKERFPAVAAFGLHDPALHRTEGPGQLLF